MITNTETAQTTETAEGIEPSILSMMAMMVAAENAEFRDLPIEGALIPFPSPFDADG